MMQANSNNELTMQLELWPFHLDLEQRYPLSQLASRMIHVSGEHATYYGFGIQKLMEHGVTWVLSRMTIDFLKPITIAHPLVISTGVQSWSGLTTDRVIRLSQNGIPVAEALSKWVAIDLKRRMPIPIEKILTDESLRSDYSNVDLPEMTKRLWSMEIQEQLKPNYEHIVRYSDLDLNCHVNTSVWISLAMDAIPIDWLRIHSMKRAHLRFIKEAREGDQLTIERYHTPEAEYLQVTCEEASYFQLLIEWAE